MNKQSTLYGLAGFFLCLSNLQAQKITDIDTTLAMREVVVSASRFTEKQLAAPVSIGKMDVRDIRQSAAPSAFDGLEHMKGVHLLTPGMGFRVINTRGFSNTTNVRFVQLVDGVDNQAPHIGAPIATVLCASDLDILNVEIIPGVATALYGMNATNGLANFITKSPFDHPGLSIRQQLAVNHVADPNGVSPKVFSETAFRWAAVLHPKWALKVNGAYTRGYDWVADNRDDLAPRANSSTGLTGADNPAYDAVNSYGNESPNRRTLNLNGKNYVVARSGYAERDVADYHLQNLKGDLLLAFRPRQGVEWSYSSRLAILDNIYHRSNRFRLEDYVLHQHTIQYKSSWLSGRAYLTGENTGDSYNLRSMAENIDRGYKTDNAWFEQYSNAFNVAIQEGLADADAHRQARLTADSGRPQPGTPAFDAQIEHLRDINNWDIGAALRVRAQLAHAEMTADMSQPWKLPFRLQLGVDHRSYLIRPDGNYFINPTDSGRLLVYSKTGFFAQAVRHFFDEKLTLTAVLRADKSQYFPLRWNPRFTAVYRLKKEAFLRLSYQTGYRFPSIFEGFSNVNSGGVRRVGGLRVMSEGIFENSWLRSSIETFQNAVNQDVNTLGLSQAGAIEKNKSLLQRNTYTYLKPEKMHAFEAGYRAVLGAGRLALDLDGYYNLYSNFIAQVEANIPNTDDPAQYPTYLYDRRLQSRYRLWTNSKTVVHNFGATFEGRFRLNDRYSVTGNVSYARLRRTEQNDGLEDGFNTPSWITNLSWHGNHVWRRLSYGVTAHWQSRYYWQSFLVNGAVPAVFNLDVHLRYNLLNPLLELKLGATNVLNRYYYSMLGGPSVGGFYYVTATWQIQQ